MGFLSAAQFAPGILVGLYAGIVADRFPRRLLMIVADVGRATILTSIPLVAVSDRLSIEYLYFAAFAAGVLTVVFDVAYASYLPQLVPRERLVDANGKLAASQSIALMGGPPLGGALVQLVGAPVALLADAASFLISAFFLGRIREVESSSEPRSKQASFGGQLWEGLGFVARNPTLRAIAASTASLNLFVSVILTLYVLYLTRALGITPNLVGVIFAMFGPGSLLGATLANRVTSRFGVGRSVVVAILVAGVADFAIPLSSEFRAAAIPILIIAQLIIGFTGPVYMVSMVSLRQALTPIALQGRISATMRFIIASTLPVGALMAGFLGKAIGLQPALLVAAIGVLASSLWLLASPVPSLRMLPTAE